MTSFFCNWNAASSEWTSCDFDFFFNKTTDSLRASGSPTPQLSTATPPGVFGVDSTYKWEGAKSGRFALDNVNKTSQSAQTYSWAAGVDLSYTDDDELVVDLLMHFRYNNTGGADYMNRASTYTPAMLDPNNIAIENQYMRWPISIYTNDGTGERLTYYYLLRTERIDQSSQGFVHLVHFGNLYAVAIDDAGVHHYSNAAMMFYGYETGGRDGALSQAGRISPFQQAVDRSGYPTPVSEWNWGKMQIVARTNTAGPGSSLLTAFTDYAESPLNDRTEPSIRSGIDVAGKFSSIRFGLEDLHWNSPASHDMLEFNIDGLSGYAGHNIITNRVTDIKGSINQYTEKTIVDVQGHMTAKREHRIHSVLGIMAGMENAASTKYKIMVWNYRGDPDMEQQEATNERRMQDYFNNINPAKTLDADDIDSARIIMDELEVRHDSPATLKFTQKGGARWTKGTLSIGDFIVVYELKIRDEGGINETTTEEALFRGRVHTIERDQETNDLVYTACGPKQICSEISISTAYIGARGPWLYGLQPQGPVESNKICYNVVPDSPNIGFAVNTLWGEYNDHLPYPHVPMKGYTIGQIIHDMVNKLERDSSGVISKRGGMMNSTTHMNYTHGKVALSWDDPDRATCAVAFKPGMQSFGLVPGEIELTGSTSDAFETLVALQPGARWRIDPETGQWIFEVAHLAPEFGIRIDKPGVTCKIEDDLSGVATAVKFISPYRSEKIVTASWAMGTLGRGWDGNLERTWDTWVKDLSNWTVKVRSAANCSPLSSTPSIRAEITVQGDGTTIPASSWKGAILEVLTGKDKGSTYKVYSANGQNIYLKTRLKEYPSGTGVAVGLVGNDDIKVSDDTATKSKFGPAAAKNGYKRVWRSFQILESPGGRTVDSRRIIPDPCMGIRSMQKLPRGGNDFGTNTNPSGGIWGQYIKWLTSVDRAMRNGTIVTGGSLLIPLDGSGPPPPGGWASSNGFNMSLSGSNRCVAGGAYGTPNFANGEDIQAVIRVVEEGAWITRHPKTGFAGRAYTDIESWHGTVTNTFSDNRGFIDDDRLWTPGRFNSNNGRVGTATFLHGGIQYIATIKESGKDWITLEDEPVDASGNIGVIAVGWEWEVEYDRAWGVAREIVAEEPGFDSMEMLPLYTQMAAFKHAMVSDPVRRGSIELPWVEWKFLEPSCRINLWRLDYWTGLETLRGLVSSVRFDLIQRTSSVEIVSSTYAWATESAEATLRERLINKATDLRNTQQEYIRKLLASQGTGMSPNGCNIPDALGADSGSNTQICGSNVYVPSSDKTVYTINQVVNKYFNLEKLVKANKRAGGEKIVEGDPVVVDQAGEYFMTKEDGLNEYGQPNHEMVPAIYDSSLGEWVEDISSPRTGNQPTVRREIVTQTLAASPGSTEITCPWKYPHIAIHGEFGPGVFDLTAHYVIQIEDEGRSITVTEDGSLGEITDAKIIFT